MWSMSVTTKVLLASVGTDSSLGFVPYYSALTHTLSNNFLKVIVPFGGGKQFLKNFTAIFSLQKSSKYSTECGFPNLNRLRVSCHPVAPLALIVLMCLLPLTTFSCVSTT